MWFMGFLPHHKNICCRLIIRYYADKTFAFFLINHKNSDIVGKPTSPGAQTYNFSSSKYLIVNISTDAFIDPTEILESWTVNNCAKLLKNCEQLY